MNKKTIIQQNNNEKVIFYLDGIMPECVWNADHGTVLIHIHNNHDLFSGVVIVCVKGRMGRGLKADGRRKRWYTFQLLSHCY